VDFFLIRTKFIRLLIIHETMNAIAIIKHRRLRKIRNKIIFNLIGLNLHIRIFDFFPLQSLKLTNRKGK
jgi:hypothetical protein